MGQVKDDLVFTWWRKDVRSFVHSFVLHHFLGPPSGLLLHQEMHRTQCRV